MLQSSTLLADALADRLVEAFERSYGGSAPEQSEILGEAARLVIERLSLSDALYHSAEHTALVTLVAQDILRGRRLGQPVPVDMWLHVVLAALAHDIGYVRGICRGDTPDRFVAGLDGSTVTLPRGASDAALSPWHVDRSKLFVLERFAGHPLIDAERLARNIELTRFPVPDDGDHAETGTEAGLVRAADLIGQLGDPLYPRKLNALFHEFEEIGVNHQLGYTTPADVADRYPAFFWARVEPYLGEAIEALDMTGEGRQWLANLYAHVCVMEHGRRTKGPHAAAPGRPGGLVLRELGRLR
ncbi:metal-dependent phosphohydrolase [Reyranella sp.]|uniref:metal-dependent phosphohydrolase n=1 Tax=Reyranella sp. TaxID=1929291 RepID=UPI003BACB500